MKASNLLELLMRYAMSIERCDIEASFGFPEARQIELLC